ncbi:MAG: alpha/beta fold hydrolase [Solirubrobacteraceae bacterium]
MLTEQEQARIAQPVLFVWGDRGPYGGPEVAHSAAKLMANARVEVVGDAGHHPWLADTSRVARLLLRFLAEYDA